MDQFGSHSDTWLRMDCGKLPSDNNCNLQIRAPEDQKDDLLDAAVAHAIHSHGHEDTPELRRQLSESLERE